MIKQLFLGMLTGYLFVSLGLVQVTDKTGQTTSGVIQQIDW